MGGQNKVDETILLIDFILAHKKEYAQDFLKSKNFHSSGTKEDLRERLRNLISNGKITPTHLTSFLDHIEGFGNQHIFLFAIPNSQLQRLRDIRYVKAICEKNGLMELYNNYKPFTLPESPQVISINHDNEWLTIRWVVKKEKLETIELKKGKDEEGREVLIKKFLIRKFRATTLFRVSLVSGRTDLLIHRLPSGSNYDQEKDEYLEKLDDWFGWGILDYVNLDPAISQIENSGEVRTRNIRIRTSRGSHVNIASPSTTEGISVDPEVSKYRNDLVTGIGNRGNFYWLPEKTRGILNREIHTIIYKDRVAITGECKEEEVNYVLGRIRNFIP